MEISQTLCCHILDSISTEQVEASETCGKMATFYVVARGLALEKIPVLLGKGYGIPSSYALDGLNYFLATG